MRIDWNKIEEKKHYSLKKVTSLMAEAEGEMARAREDIKKAMRRFDEALEAHTHACRNAPPAGEEERKIAKLVQNIKLGQGLSLMQLIILSLKITKDKRRGE